MPICKALLLYGYSGFSLGILEYCAPSDTLIRERYYIKLLNPEYNLCSEPGAPMLGRNHSEETKEKFRSRKHTKETKALMSAIKKLCLRHGKRKPNVREKTLI